MYNGFIFDEKGVFYILTSFSSFTGNVSINFEHKHFKSYTSKKRVNTGAAAHGCSISVLKNQKQQATDVLQIRCS